jgi:methionyl-tRNA formyltransferase
MSGMRIVFMGTPEFAVPTLEALVAARHQIVAVYSQPPRPAGRGQQLQPSPVQRAAEAHGIAVHTPLSLKGADEQAAFDAHDADVAVVAAYGLILPQAILDAPRHGCLNVHGSLLPEWRGAAPVQRAILAGDTMSGVTIMQMELGLDTGPMRAMGAMPIGNLNAGELTRDLAVMGAQLMLEVLADLDAFPRVPQPDDEASYARKIDKAESRLDFTQSAEDVLRQIRAFAPAPGAFFELEGERFRVLEAEIVEAEGAPGLALDDHLTIACGGGALRPTMVQRAGKPAMDAAALLRGRPIAAGTLLAG